MRVRQALRGAGVLLVAWVAMTSWPVAAGAEATLAFTIRDTRVTESSGLATDVASGLYWTANDSGAQGVAYGVSATGEVRGTLSFRVEPQDVEAVAMTAGRLYLGDIGDNAAGRREISVFFFDGPQADDQTVTYHSWDFRYPDGAHDAETLLVDSTGQLYVVTKGRPGAIYAAPPSPSPVTVNRLRKVGQAPAVVTDGVFLPGDRQIAFLTYTSIVVVDAKTYAEVATAPIPTQQQAESLTLSLDGQSLLVGSEGRRSKVYSMAIPAAGSSRPSAATTTTTTATPRAGSGDPGSEDAGAAGPRGRGTFLAIGLAAFVAVVAGAVAGLSRRP